LHPSHTDIVLHGNRQTREHTVIPTLRNILRLRGRPFPIDFEKGIQDPI
jgi:hypothetical protein